jgi:hypothetical protein
MEANEGITQEKGGGMKECNHWLSYRDIPEMKPMLTDEGNDATPHECVRCKAILYRVHLRPARGGRGT